MSEPDDERLVPTDFSSMIRGHISAGTFDCASFGFSERLEKGGFKRLFGTLPDAEPDEPSR